MVSGCPGKWPPPVMSWSCCVQGPSPPCPHHHWANARVTRAGGGPGCLSCWVKLRAGSKLGPGAGALRCPSLESSPWLRFWQPAHAAKHVPGLTRICGHQDAVQLPQKGYGPAGSPRPPVVVPGMDPLHPQGFGLNLALLAGPQLMYPLGHGCINMSAEPYHLAKHCLFLAPVAPLALCVRLTWWLLAGTSGDHVWPPSGVVNNRCPLWWAQCPRGRLRLAGTSVGQSWSPGGRFRCRCPQW